MPHTDPEVLALRAVGRVAGTAADDDHIATCADCRAEAARLSEVVATARHDKQAVHLAQPPDRVWERIAAAAGIPAAAGALAVPGPASGGTAGEPASGLAGQAADGAGDLPRPRPPAARLSRLTGRRGARSGVPRRRRGLLAAGAAGLVIGAGAAAAAAGLANTPGPAMVSQTALRPLPQFPQWKAASGTAVMRAAASTRQLDVTLNAPSRPGFYEVWLLGRDGVSMISLGDLSAAHTGAFTIPAGTNLQFYSRVDISLQPFNGSPVHSKASVVRGTLPAGADGQS